MLARSATTTGVRHRPTLHTGILGGAALVVVVASTWIAVDKGRPQSEDTAAADPSTVTDRASQVSGSIPLRAVNVLARRIDRGVC